MLRVGVNKMSIQPNLNNMPTQQKTNDVGPRGNFELNNCCIRFPINTFFLHGIHMKLHTYIHQYSVALLLVG